MKCLNVLLMFYLICIFSLSANFLSEEDKLLIAQHFNSYVDEGKLPHISILIKQNNKEIFRHTYGYSDLKSKNEITKDSIFRIYSMTKPVTGVAIMQLVEKGKLRLNDRVSTYIPAFKDTMVLDLTYQDYVVKTKREVTIRDLLTHTSGLTYSWAGEGPVHQIYRKNNIRPYYFGSIDSEITKFPGSTCDFATAAAKAPLVHNPGEQWSYGINMDILGCIVEVVSGLTFDQYLRLNIFNKLGLNSMGFNVQPEDLDNFTTLYTSGLFRRDGEIVGAAKINPSELMFARNLRAIDAFNASPYLTKPNLFDGGSGLVSNIDDYSKFAEMLLNGGILDGKRILSTASIELMSRNHLKDELLSKGSTFGINGVGFGLTLGVIMDAGQAGTFSSDGEYYWGGAASTVFWVDKKNNLTATMMTQYMPSDKYPIREELKTLLYSKLSN